MRHVPVSTTDTGDRRSIDPVIEAYRAHVDLALIREQIRRTPDERVARMIGALRLAEALRAAGRR